MSKVHKRVLLLGDSFGIERHYQGQIYVPAQQTWPQQVKRYFADWHIETDFKSFRRYVDLPDMINQQWADVDIVVVHAGIVDCYPRPLSSRITRSTKSRHRTLRRLVRRMRRFWLNYIYNKPWSSANDIKTASDKLVQLGRNKQLIVLTPSPVLTHEYLTTPGAQDAIIDFSNHLRQLAEGNNITLIDVHAAFMATSYQRFLHPQDAHFNQAGNDYVASLVIDMLQRLTKTVE